MTLTRPSALGTSAALLLAFTGCATSHLHARDAASSSGSSAASTGHSHGTPVAPRAELAPNPDFPLNPSKGTELGLVFESYLSPQQEGGEEEDMPKGAPKVFASTKPSTPREKRPGRGHGVVAFNKEFSRAYVHLALEGIDPKEIVMAHLHCGLPGQLGPIIVDFSKTGVISDYFADGRLDIEVTNRDLEMVIEGGEGLVGAFTAGCAIEPLAPGGKIQTIGGMAVVASKGHLYFNVHTAAQTFFGDIRGQLLPVKTWPEVAEEATKAGARPAVK